MAHELARELAYLAARAVTVLVAQLRGKAALVRSPTASNTRPSRCITKPVSGAKRAHAKPVSGRCACEYSRAIPTLARRGDY